MILVPWWAVVLAILAVVLLVAALLASATATRLNRMHVRTDLARSSLEAALGRRGAVARAAYPELGPDVARAEARRLTSADPHARADAENTLGAKLAEALDARPPEAALAIELHDATTRVELARRFYNDAVTDTRMLRMRPLVRGLRLAGTAPIPEYFDASVEAPQGR
ncbi:MAG TPA: LemA family protein [Corynebacterium sp.]|mgnify:CR=1 FL=1|uniref:NUDIX hydrolase n=1 Tax=Corynebacterium sp. TaxID=1720 RepID=UPI0018456423|nr:NUDIX hydrolase [Corynebacterium sp.]HHT33336.1 LemA family protein [Corynebacterium sp.]